MHTSLISPSTGFPTRARPRKPLSKEKWIVTTTAEFSKIVESADIEGDEEISDILFDLTDYEIDGPVSGTLYKVLDKIYDKRNHIKLALDCRDVDGNVWVAILKWHPKSMEYVRKATLWTTIDACANANTGVAESVGSVESKQGFVPASMPPKVDWVKAWTLEECYDEYDVSDDEDWVIVYECR